MKAILILITMYLMILNSYTQNGIIPFESDRWEKKNAREAEFLGRKCLMGIATLKDLAFENGVIELDLAVTGERSYPGVIFRAQTQDDYERIYIRPHRTVIDGLKSDRKGNFLISDYDGRLIRVSPEGKTDLLLNTKSRQITLADFEYIPGKNLLVIPTFTDNRLMMYKFME
jgi:hypothetical protein